MGSAVTVPVSVAVTMNCTAGVAPPVPVTVQVNESTAAGAGADVTTWPRAGVTGSSGSHTHGPPAVSCTRGPPDGHAASGTGLAPCATAGPGELPHPASAASTTTAPATATLTAHIIAGKSSSETNNQPRPKLVRRCHHA